MIRFFAFLVVFFLLVGVGSVCVGQLVSDTSIISLSGEDWSLKVDGVLQSSLDSRNVPYMTSKSVTEKELFLELASLEDCKSGVVQFKVDMLGLTAYKQLPLDVELDVKEYEFVNSTHAINGSKVVVYRPENIVNSFALFDDSGRKQVHISASKLVASDGASVWCDSNLEVGLLTVVLPIEWLEGAKFPVVLDPVFGYNTIGATNSDWFVELISGSRDYLSVDATLTQISLYLSEATAFASVAIYNDSINNPTTLIAESSPQAVSGAGWFNFTFNTHLQSNKFYWLAMQVNGTTTHRYWDTSVAQGFDQTWTPYGAFDVSLTDEALADVQYSIYATYEEYSEATPSPSPSPSSTLTPITSGELNNAMLFVLGFMVVMCVVGLVWLSRVPVVVLLIGLFAVLVGLYCALGGVYNLGVVQGWFSLFVALFGGLTMLLVGLGVRVRR